MTAAVVAGVAATLYCTREELPENRMVELLGALIGGYLGGRLPDLLDPPLSPLHRSYAHGGFAVAAVATARLEEWRRTCRRDAARCSLAGRGVEGFLLLFVAGFLTGLRAGYASHLALDACTPRGLPLLGR